VMLRTVQCRPAAACARKSPLRVHSKETRQDKTRHKKKNQLNSTQQKKLQDTMSRNFLGA
jgi:hypothetical protein